MSMFEDLHEDGLLHVDLNILKPNNNQSNKLIHYYK